MSGNVSQRIRDALESLISDKKTVVRILSVVLILLIALILRMHDDRKADITIESAGEAEETELSEEGSVRPQIFYVDIGGAVEKPGVYEVSKGTRLFEVIDMAGGLSEEADTDHVNRASFVEDGQKIIIPEKGSDSAAAAEGLSSASAG